MGLQLSLSEFIYFFYFTFFFEPSDSVRTSASWLTCELNLILWEDSPACEGISGLGVIWPGAATTRKQ